MSAFGISQVVSRWTGRLFPPETAAFCQSEMLLFRRKISCHEIPSEIEVSCADNMKERNNPDEGIRPSVFQPADRQLEVYG